MNTIINGIVYKDTKVKTFEVIYSDSRYSMDSWIKDNVETLLDMKAVAAGAGAGAHNEGFTSLFVIITYISKSENQQ